MVTALAAEASDARSGAWNLPKDTERSVVQQANEPISAVWESALTYRELEEYDRARARAAGVPDQDPDYMKQFTPAALGFTDTGESLAAKAAEEAAIREAREFRGETDTMGRGA